MRAEGRSVLSAAGVPVDAITFRYAIDARYYGQGNEITITLGEGASWPATPDAVTTAFAERYAAVYGMTIPGVPVEVVTWRISAFAPAPEVALQAGGANGRADAQKGTRPVRVGAARRRSKRPCSTAPCFVRATPSTARLWSRSARPRRCCGRDGTPS